MAGSYRTALRDAIATIIVNLGLVPTTTVSVASNVGDSTLQVANASNFVTGGIASFWDGTTEFPCVIATTNTTSTPQTVTLSFQGRSVSGLQSSHAPGAVLATNILTTRPNRQEQGVVQTMLANGYPVLRVFVWASSLRWEGASTTMPRMAADLIYQLPLDQVAAPQGWLQSDLWTLQQDNRAEADMASLINNLRQNSRVIVNGTSNALAIDQWNHVAAENHVDAQFPLYEMYGQLILRGVPRDISVPQ
jgi:hypothetical protein